MKAITIKQPWASLIVHGIKDIENRSWSTKFRGRVLIHAAGVVDPAKVARVALENAASIAGMFLTTECVIVEKKEDKPEMPMGAPGMGGMGGMM